MMTPQLALDLSLEPDYRADSFCISGSNIAALDAVNRWPRWREGHLLVVGPKGSGKTHLSEIWAQQSQASRIQPEGISGCLNTVKRGCAVLVENIDRGCDEDGLFHLINRSRGDAGVSLLITATGHIDRWNITLPDLISRLKASETAMLNEPDDALLIQVMEKLFRDLKTPLSPGLVEYLSPRMERSIGFARMLTTWLDREALARKGPVTRPLAREALSALSGR